MCIYIFKPLTEGQCASDLGDAHLRNLYESAVLHKLLSVLPSHFHQAPPICARHLFCVCFFNALFFCDFHPHWIDEKTKAQTGEVT